MSERTCVWVKSSVIQKALGVGDASVGKSVIRKTPIDYERSGGEWTWVLAEVLSGDISAVASHADAFSTNLKVRVVDEASDFDGKEVDMRPDLLKSTSGGPRVEMANEYVASEDSELPPDDLITLTHLHEPSVVFCLRKRYDEDLIYTDTGPILLVVNPYKSLPGLYDENAMNSYSAHGDKALDKAVLAQGLKPHIYGNADAAFRKMMLGLDLKKDGVPDVVINQAILVSGESGAGKTVTTKHIMKYLATLSERKAEHAKRRRAPSPGRGEREPVRRGTSIRGLSRVQSWKAGAQIEEKILESNPILESFGNARTIRNDNSSRFGKFIQLQFRQTGSLIGAAVDTYLLETVRLIYQGPEERNYHIFYEMLAAATKAERRQFYLGDYTVKDFKMTNSSGTYDRRDGARDDELFDELVLALGTMGFDPQTQDDIFGVTTAFLHASNLTMLAVTDDSSQVDGTNPHLIPVLKLLGLEKDAFESALCEFEIEAGNTSYTKQVSKEFAEKGLEALVKSTYGAMFSFIVQTVNKKIDYKPKRGEPSAVGKAGSIGVLDIFGFESFQSNSFEQLCINYCNEALQQQFNLFIFKTEQEEYKREGIEWDFIEFPDNKDVIELIDKKGSGIISILTDQCRNLRGTDKTFVDQVYNFCDSHSRFEASGLVRASGQFVVHHYAGPVKYETEGFVEKNKDEIPRGASDLLINSSNAFVQLLGQITVGPSSKKAGAKRPTVGSTFTLQLAQLRKRIDETSPHYVRCLKPNQSLRPDDFNNAMIADQLRYAGVLEAIRVSRVGYSQRYDHSLFVARYRFLAMGKVKAATKEDQVGVLVDVIAEKIWAVQNPNDAVPSDTPSAVGIQKGSSKVFLRQTAFEYMERFRTEQLGSAAIVIQAQVRGFLVRCRYLRDRQSIILVQSCVRGFLSRKRFAEMRKRTAATKIQSFYRMSEVRTVFLKKKYVALWCQKHERGHLGRCRYSSLHEKRKAELAMEALDYRSATTIQCMYRSRKARDTLAGLKSKKAKMELSDSARIVDAEKKKADIETYRAKAVAKEVAYEKDKEVDELRKELQAQTVITGRQLESAREEVAKLKLQLEESQAELEASRKSAETALFKLAAAETENKKLKEQVNSGVFVTGAAPYKTTTFNDHEDLKQLDERMHGISARAQQSKKDLQALVQALAILK